MRNTFPLLARAVSTNNATRADSPSFEIYTQTPPVHPFPNPNIPAIRLVHATPSFDASLAGPDASNSTILAPRELPSPRKKLVPKKSKLALLASRASSTREKDLSDVVRRVHARGPMSEGDGTCNVTVNGGTLFDKKGHRKKGTDKNASSRSTIDIYVDPADDPDIGEIVVVKKKKSRAGLDGIRWALGEVTNAPEEAPPAKKKEDTEKVKLKVEEKERWWSIGRGRRDSKSKDKEDKVTTGTASKFKLRPKAPSASAVPAKLPEPQQSRPRNHSLDSGLLLSIPPPTSALHPSSQPYANPIASVSTPFLTLTPSPAPSPTTDCFSADRETESHYSKSARQRSGSTPGLLLSPPDSGYGEAFSLPRLRVNSENVTGEGSHQAGGGKGSIAIRAMKSLARIGSWAQLRNSNTNANTAETGKEKTKLASKRGNGAAPGKTSSSSFEVGALSSPGRGGDDTTYTTVNHINTQRFSTMAALGHGLPPILLNPNTATQRVSSGSTTSMSLNVPNQTCRPTRLSAGSSSSGENTSSSRPGSTYTASGEDNTGTNTWNLGAGAGAVAGKKKSSVRWGGVVVGGTGEKKGKSGKVKDGKEKGKEKDSKKSSGEGRRRTPVMSVFPQLSLSIRASKANMESTNQSEPNPAVPIPVQQQATASPREEDEDDLDGEVDEEACVRYAVRVPTFTRDSLGTAHTKLPSKGGGLPIPVPAFTTATTISYATVRAAPPNVEDADVPPARPRPRPLSEQLLGGTRQRPKGILGSIGTLGDDPQALSVLEAANCDLASLINCLDLAATPDSKMSKRVSYALTDQTTSSRLGEGTVTSSIRAMENYVRGFGRNLGAANTVEDSPLKKKSATGNPSLTSLKPGVYKAQTQAQGQTVLPALPPPPPPPKLPPVSDMIGQPIVPWAQLLEQTDKALAEEERERQTERAREETDVLEPLRRTQVKQEQAQPRLRRTSSTSLRTRAAPFMRTPSMLSTFGTNDVLVKSTPENQDAPTEDGKMTKYTFGVPPVRYRLPSVESLSSVAADGFGFGVNADETPTRKGHGHRRQLSHLVPVKKVKEVVQTFEARTRMEREKEAAMKTPTNAGGRSRKRSTLDAATRKELGFKGTLGMHDDEVESPVTEGDEDSDIPDELRIVLSQSDKDDAGAFPADAGVEDTLSFVPTKALAASASNALPPSPGLPPSAPLPDPRSTPESLSTTSPALRVSPPAPTMLPFLEPSPSPSQSPVPLLTLLPPPRLAVKAPLSDHDPSAEADNEHASSSSDSEDTKQSFDFTGELAKLNESGGAHRRSFVEQLEEAFKTPVPAAKLGLGLGAFLSVGEKQTEMEGMAAEEVRGKPSYGRLDMAFKFGGKPQEGMKEEKPVEEDSLAFELPGVAALSTVDSPPMNTVNSMGLPHQRRRSLSTSIIEEDSSVLRSIFVQAAELRSTEVVQARATKLSLESDTSSKRRARMSTVSNASGLDARYSHARNTSDLSFSGMSSFGAVRTRFEFGPNTSRPSYFHTSFPSTSHARQESMFSIASISSYGEVIKDGLNDPFNYGRPGGPAMDLDEERDRVDALSSFDARRKKRFSTESDGSGFYFRSGHHRNASVVSNNSIAAPPISLYNRSFGHKRNDSAGSASSVAMAYANGGWLKQHKTDKSIDSVMSDFSAMRLGRPGIGEKMFDHLVADHAPLSAISASPPESVVGTSNELGQKSSYDSILDEDRRSTLDSIFDNTGQRSSMSSDSVFGYEASSGPSLYPPTLFRPLSVITVHNPSSPHEDDTMITMLGGEHVRRRSIGSSFEASPCFRVEKRKHTEFEEHQEKERARLMRQDSVASSMSSTSAKLFGETRMSLAKNGLLHRNSLEDSCLSAEGEEDLSISLNTSMRSSVFNRPVPSSRARQWPKVTVSHPPDTTPPLSSSEGSQSGGSQSSIDISRLKVLLQTASAGQTSSRSRARARGQGHRRRPSQMSRSSLIVDTIQEENPGLSHSPSASVDVRSNRNSFDSVASVVPSESEPPIEIMQWDDERFTLGLRKYYALRSEADETIVQSRTVWPNTSFSLHALQTFTAPKHPAGMQALLEHSQKTYIPLPHDWRPRRIRSRTSSINRSAPYPRSTHRPTSSSGSSTGSRRSSIDGSFDRSRALQPLSPTHNTNLISPAPALAAISPFSPLAFDINNQSNDSVEPVSVIKPAVRPRVGSAARRNALGWTKRKTPKASSKTKEGKSFFNGNKENEAHGLLTSPPESLRIVRPRPRSRMISATPRSASLLA